MKQIKFILFFLIISFSFVKSNDNTTNSSNTTDKPPRDFFGLLLSIFEGLEVNCSAEFGKIFSEFRHNTPETIKKYPWMFDSLGKSFNDIGDETECINTLRNTSFIMVNLYDIRAFQYVQNVSNDLYNFLELKNHSIGICIMDLCKDTFYRYIQMGVKFINNVTNNIGSPDQISFFENSNYDKDSKMNIQNYQRKSSYTLKNIFLYIFRYFIIAKIIGGIARIVFLPKGYNKYILAKENKNKNGIDIDEIEEKSIVPKKRRKYKESLIDDYNIKEYNPLFDYTDKLPIYYKILKIFDIWDDLFYLSSVRNKYFNDVGLEVINFNRTVTIFFLTFFHTFSAFIELPSEEIINSHFFKHPFNILYRLSNNALICWIFLEGAHTTYKLLCFISNEYFIYQAKGNNNKNNFNVRLIIIYGKFLLLLLPKMIEFFAVYYLLYYNIEDYSFFLDAKATFTHIITHIFKKEIKCNSITNLYNYNFSFYFPDYNTCYEFIYFYINMFLAIIFSMIIIYLFFLIKNPIFEIIIMVLNLAYFFGSIELIKDPKNEEGKKFLEYHITGQTYTTKMIHSFVGCFHLGLITGFILFNSEGIKKRINKLIYENYLNYFSKNEINNNNENDDILSNASDENSYIYSNSNSNSNLNSAKDIKNKIQSFSSSINYTNFKLPYYPLKYLNTKVLDWLKRKSFYFKLLIILFCVIIIITIDFILLIVLMADKSFNIDLSFSMANIFKYEKHIFILLFFVINIIMITLPKKGILKDLMTARIVVFVSRIGFLLSCVVFAFTYFLFIIFNLRVKLYVPTIILMTFGNFLFISLICFFIYTMFEFPLQYLIKTLLRIGRNKEKASI